MNDEKMELGNKRGRKKDYMFDDSCVICGNEHVESGRIFHGHCVCEECVEYILSLSDNETGEENEKKEIDQESAQKTFLNDI